MERNSALHRFPLQLSSHSRANSAANIHFCTVIRSSISPEHSPKSAVATIPCRARPLNCKNFPYDRQAQDRLVNTARPLLPDFISFPSLESRPSARVTCPSESNFPSMDVSRSPDDFPNQTDHEMICQKAAKFGFSLSVVVARFSDRLILRRCVWAKIGHLCSILNYMSSSNYCTKVGLR